MKLRQWETDYVTSPQKELHLDSTIKPLIIFQVRSQEDEELQLPDQDDDM